MPGKAEQSGRREGGDHVRTLGLVVRQFSGHTDFQTRPVRSDPHDGGTDRRSLVVEDCPCKQVGTVNFCDRVGSAPGCGRSDLEVVEYKEVCLG